MGRNISQLHASIILVIKLAMFIDKNCIFEEDKDKCTAMYYSDSGTAATVTNVQLV